MKTEFHDKSTALQLKVLKELSSISTSLGSDIWLRGGWAIDFMLGKVTRTHDDIDFVTWIHHREQLEEDLLKAGYQRVEVKEEFRNRQSDFCMGTVELSCCYIDRTLEGRVIMNELPEWVWQSDALSSQYFILDNIPFKTLSPKQLLEEKEIYEQIGRKPRRKDLESKEKLRLMIEQSN
ncbi:nucleotidyltransferase domain-containing protein [Jeotgalibacillus salarius]|uniref:Aminoglycoside adenylyltransferase n=1 Tax=Jeotgalibacillus salarius TaxID=546023 RepID=A0A4Y8LBN6_9BACL|nr:hypothetical protein [Jeotgalibacillus salarius]TFD99478.1 hypothetical protein E2626_14560 [Jeotgalibacillus salarius]